MFKITIIFLLPLLSAAQSGIATAATFGRHSDCASGRGACSFSLSKSETGKHSRKASENTLVLEMNNGTLTNEDQIRIAGKPFKNLKENEGTVFIQYEAIMLDSTSLEALNLNGKLKWIPAGNYPMQITKDKTEIIFTLKTSN